jgi:hypothetical protein
MASSLTNEELRLMEATASEDDCGKAGGTREPQQENEREILSSADFEIG